MSRLSVLLAFTLLALAPVSAAEDLEAMLEAAEKAEQKRVELVKRLLPSVVVIFPTLAPGGGSGVIISEDGYVLTNYHVVQQALQGGRNPNDRKVRCGLPDGKIYPGKVVGIDVTADLALVRMEGNNFPAAELGDSDSLKVGDWTFAMGNPFLLATDFKPTVTMGIVSGLHRYLEGIALKDSNKKALRYPDAVQVDTSINPGNSGGPLFDMNGKIVGINGRISVRERGRMNIGVGFAISTPQIRNFLPDLRAGRLAEHGFMDCTFDETGKGDVYIREIYADNSAAKRGGLKLGDVIVAIDGHPIRSQKDLLNRLGILAKGWEIEVTYRRDGKEGKAQVTLAGLLTTSDMETIKFAVDETHNRWELNRILKRHRETLGGKKALAARMEWKVEGTIVRGKNRIPFQAEFSRPDELTWTEGVGEDQKILQVSGSTVTEREGKEEAEKLPEEEEAPHVRDRLFEEALWSENPLDIADRAEFVGGGRVGTTVCDRILFTIQGEKRTYWFDSETGHLKKIRTFSATHGLEIDRIYGPLEERGELGFFPRSVTLQSRGRMLEQRITEKVEALDEE